MILGIDIGGANTKIASNDAKLTKLHHIPLWKNNSLVDTLLIYARLKPEKVGVVITGELTDCFPDKEAGISYIVDVVNDVFNNAYFLDYYGNFTRDKKKEIAAANWTASSLVIAKEYRDCIFVDIGSTTTDIIPIKNGTVHAAKTDFERLKQSELVYSGVLRTNIATVLNTVDLNGDMRISSEFFAISADAYLVLSMISQEDYTCDTPDGASKTVEDAKRRIARVVCSDLTEIGDIEIISIASQFMEKQLEDIIAAINSVAEHHGLDKIVACGIGEFLARKAAQRLGFESVMLSERYGKAISKIFPAYAVALLVETLLSS